MKLSRANKISITLSFSFVIIWYLVLFLLPEVSGGVLASHTQTKTKIIELALVYEKTKDLKPLNPGIKSFNARQKAKADSQQYYIKVTSPYIIAKPKVQSFYSLSFFERLLYWKWNKNRNPVFKWNFIKGGEIEET